MVIVLSPPWRLFMRLTTMLTVAAASLALFACSKKTQDHAAAAATQAGDATASAANDTAANAAAAANTAADKTVAAAGVADRKADAAANAAAKTH
jgi:hypothetical protein